MLWWRLTERKGKRGGADGAWVWVSVRVVACWRRGWPREDHVGLCFGGVQDAACLIQPLLGRVLWRRRESQSCCQLLSWFPSVARGLTAGGASLCTWGPCHRAGGFSAWLCASPQQGCRSQAPACNRRKGANQNEISITAVTLHTLYDTSVSFTCPRNVLEVLVITCLMLPPTSLNFTLLEKYVEVDKG